MPITKDNISLELAKRLSEQVNSAWEDGSFLSHVTPITKDLLRFWFAPEYMETRRANFHKGQRQAIMNVIYLHEVLQAKNVYDVYEKTDASLLQEADLAALAEQKNQYCKYAIKMATGTGKTWVMHALMIWQLLNARSEDTPSGRYTQKFLIIAPGLIVYDRLKDAFCGRIARGSEVRTFDTNDFSQNQDVFLPPKYRHEVLSFVSNNVVCKEEGIGKKTTGDGLIALTNWHLFENQVEEEAQEESLVDMPDAKQIVKDLLPVSPGTAAGNALDTLDAKYMRGTELEYLAGLDSLMVINDEAHHTHADTDVIWQRGLDNISAGVGERYMQVDFSATPYEEKGGGRNKRKVFFPHIVVDFDLPEAIKNGLVKLLLLDRRKELTDIINLDYNARRDDRGKVVGLSDGQRIMLRAGLTKLRKLEGEFLKIDEKKNPKMLVMCEDTNVSPFVVDFLKNEGLEDSDVLKIDSITRGEMNEEQWKQVKTQLFDIDKYAQPKVIVSVLMLREGFDVNNICVIVPLRSSKASILLEQTIGRGLRLMWREPEYAAIKEENLRRVLVRKEAPRDYIDTLSIVEHPAFIEFYNELFEQGLAGTDENDVPEGGRVLGDMIKVGLKDGYEDYDFAWPLIMREASEELSAESLDISVMQPFTLFSLEKLRKALATDGETFVTQEVINKTQFGEYRVSADLFTAISYNEYLQKILNIITQRRSQRKYFFNLQVFAAAIVSGIDTYIRTKLFDRPFDPFNGSDWKILLTKNGIVTQHIVQEAAKAIHKMQEAVQKDEAVVTHINFSTVSELRMRENYSLKLQKTIYERLSYPSNSGGFEEKLMKFLDCDGEVERFLKINETQHDFATIAYINTDGLVHEYHPDFIVGTADKIYLIETKSKKDVTDVNVRRKQVATIEWLKKVNALPAADRMERTWEYVLLSQDNFESLRDCGASLRDICVRCQVSLSAATGNLFADME